LSLSAQISARNVERGFDVELAAVFPDLRKGDVLRMAHQPGGLMIERGCTVLQGADPEGYWQASTLRPEPAAWGYGEVPCDFGLSGESHALPDKERSAVEVR
jgi:hypothetical protein